MAPSSNGINLLETSSSENFNVDIKNVRRRIDNPKEREGLAKDIHSDMIDITVSEHRLNSNRAKYFRTKINALEEKQKNLVQLPSWLVTIINVVDWLVNHPKISIPILGAIVTLASASNRGYTLLDVINILLKAVS